MSDLVFNFQKDTYEFDLGIKNWDLENDDGLETAILVSLFSDARCELDELPEGESDRKGFWADAIVPSEEKNTGSKLWLLDRGKLTDETLEQALDYCNQALRWLVDDGVASRVEVDVQRVPRRNDAIVISVDVYRPDASDLSFKFDYVWGERASGIRTT